MKERKIIHVKESASGVIKLVLKQRIRDSFYTWCARNWDESGRERFGEADQEGCLETARLMIMWLGHSQEMGERLTVGHYLDVWNMNSDK